MSRRSTFHRHSYGWITLILALGSLAAHFALAMLNGDDVATWAQEVAENWQSEFLQLIWQVVGLAWFFQVGSPASKEASDRVEAKLDWVARQFPGGQAEM